MRIVFGGLTMLVVVGLGIRFKFYKKREFDADGGMSAMVLGSVAYLLAVIVGICADNWLGEERPGAFWEKRKEYQREVYVNLFPKQSALKNYRLPGLVEKINEPGHGEDNPRRTIYWLRYVRWPNGGTTYFQNYESLELNSRVEIRDEESRLWDVELTDSPVK